MTSTNRKYKVVSGGLFGNRKDRALVSIIVGNCEVGCVTFSINNQVVNKLAVGGNVTSSDIENCGLLVKETMGQST